MSAVPSFGMAGASAYRPGLERILELDRILGNPSRGMRCIHVAGTNGKGSVCNMLAASLASEGLKVGLYTSPQILDFRERIRIVRNGGYELVPKEWVFDFLSKNAAAVSSIKPSFFEITTAMCFGYFSEQNVDIAVMETGLGGRFDATNIVTPVLSVITNVGYDHMNILGNTLEKIAAEKAGIIKKGVPAVVGEYDPTTAPVFEEAARQAETRLIFADRDFICCLPPMERMDLSGCYQKKNLRTLACALDVCGYAPRPDVLSHVARICGFHGRWEKILDNPLTICDIGHNEHGLKYNFAQLSEMLSSGEISDIVMVYGSMKDKDVDAVLSLVPPQAEIVFTAAASPRAMPADELLSRYSSLVRRAECGPFEACASVGRALGLAMEKCAALRKPLLYVGGSAYVVAEALESLGVDFEAA